MPDAADALPGRDQRPFDVPDTHFVLGTPLEPPFPADTEQVIVGMGCFWGAEKDYWQAPGMYTTAVGYAAGYTPNPTYEEVCSGRTGHNEVVLAVFRPGGDLLRGDAAAVLGGPRPDPGHAPGQRRGQPVPLGYLRDYATRSAPRRRRRATVYAEQLGAAGYGEITTEILDARGVLLRRGLPPAVPGQEPRRLLRHRRHRRGLPGRRWPGA